jgi:8-oxo-dGTP pyrophosphatase MutT (NUDIX family)
MQEEQINPWKVIDEQQAYDNQWISLIHYNVVNPSGNKGIYGKVHFKNKAIGVVAIDADMNTYLVGQYRFTIDKYSWEIPEGGCAENENPLDAAKRELLEEAGIKAAHWELIGDVYLSNSVTDEHCLYYLATGLTQHAAEPEETEQLSVQKISLQHAFEYIDNGTITDALSIMALQKVQLMLMQDKLKL